MNGPGLTEKCLPVNDHQLASNVARRNTTSSNSDDNTQHRIVTRNNSKGNNSNNSHAKKWISDSSYDACFGCMRKFNVFHRRHHCRLCGQLFCKSCSNYRVLLSPEQGYVRACDVCYAKQHLSTQNSKGFNGAGRDDIKKKCPIPKSIFAIVESQAAIAVSFDAEACETAICLMAPTLSCRCYEGVEGPLSVQCAHFELRESKRVRIDLQFQGERSVLFTMRLHTKSSLLIGIGFAYVQALPESGLRLLDDFRIELQTPNQSLTKVACGSLAWKLSDNMKSPILRKNGSAHNRLRLQHVIEAEIKASYDALNTAQERESQHRMSFNAIASNIENIRRMTLHSNQSVSSSMRLSPTTAQLSPSSAAKMRHRRSTQWEAVEDLLSERNQLQVKSEHLQLLQQSLKLANNIDDEQWKNIALSCICFRCFGTITI